MNTDLFVWLKPWGRGRTTADYFKLEEKKKIREPLLFTDLSSILRVVMRLGGGYHCVICLGLWHAL